MEINIKRLVRIIVGVVILIIGIIGLFLPFLQGIAMILLGLHFICPNKTKIIVRKGKAFFNEKTKKRKRD